MSEDTALVSEDTFAENSQMIFSHSSLLRVRGVGARSRGQPWLRSLYLSISVLAVAFPSLLVSVIL